MSLIDTWAATGAGAFTLTENGLYTVEAWQRFLDRLNPGGVFTVSRWYAPGEVNETGRLVSLGVATLLAKGAAEPRRHLFLAAAGNVATLIVAKSPLSPVTLAALKDAAKANEFTVLLSPDGSAPSAMLEQIVSAPDRCTLDQATAGVNLDLTAPTDARRLTLVISRECLSRIRNSQPRAKSQYPPRSGADSGSGPVQYSSGLRKATRSS